MGNLDTDQVRSDSTPTAWVDLAGNRPGASLRAMAAAEREPLIPRSRVLRLLTRRRDLSGQERRWRVGAEGEEFVGARLERLADRGWRVIHSIGVGQYSCDIDHLLVGPGGVFTINTKHHPGGKLWIAEHKILVNGHDTAYLRDSRREAPRAERLLSAALGRPVPVTAVLIVHGHAHATVKQRPSDVVVIGSRRAPRHFKNLPRVLQDPEIAEIFEVARRSTTWKP